MEKMTKKEAYERIRGILIDACTDAEIEALDELIDFVDAEMEHLEKRAEKAKERAAQKRAEGDELQKVVESVLTNEFQDGGAITELVQAEIEDVSRAKVTARLTQLVKAGVVEKEQQKIGSSKLMCYRLVETSEDVE